MPVYVISKIVPKNGAFTGVVDANQVLGGTSNKVPDNAVSESSVTQHSTALATSITEISDLQQEKLEASTGPVFGGELSVNSGDPALYDLSPGRAYIVDSHTDPANPVFTTVDWDEQIGVLVPNIAVQGVTVIAVDKDGLFQQLSTLPTPSQSRDLATLGALIHPGLTITGVGDAARNINTDLALREMDFQTALGLFVKEKGLELSPNGTDLKFDRAEGVLYSPGGNYDNDKKDPNRGTVAEDSPVLFYRGTANGFIPAAPVYDIPVDQYDPDGGGVLVDIPSGHFIVHRIYYGSASQTTALLYGQHAYDSLKKAIDSFDNEVVATTTPYTEAICLGVIIVQEGATDLSDPFQANFVNFGALGIRTLSSVEGIERFAEGVELLDGCSYQQQEITYVHDNGTIYADVERKDGGDLTYVFDQQEFTLDCTNGAGQNGKARIALIAGTALDDPELNYLYVTKNGGGLVAQLNVSTTRPEGEYAAVGKVYLPDPTTFLAEGTYACQRYTEAKSHNERGAIAHIKEVLRAKGATWDDGLAPTGSIDDGVSPNVVDLEVTSGHVYQLHRQTVPSLQVSVNGVFIANADGGGAYSKFQKALTLGLPELANGDALVNNQRFNLVVWGVSNQTDADCKLFVNLPNGSYGDDASAYADSDNTAVVSIPSEFIGGGFLIARIPLKYSVVGGGSYEFINNAGQPEIIDLRGNPAGVSGSGASGSSSTFADSIFHLLNNTDSTKVLDFDVSPVSTATTRTITMADADVDLADIALNNTHRTDSNTFKASRQTLDGATYNDLGSVSLAADAYYFFEGTVVAKEVGTTDMRSWKFYAVADQNGVVSGASYTEISVFDSGGASTPANWTLSSTVVSDSWRLEVTGEAGTTINWDTRFQYNENAD